MTAGLSPEDRRALSDLLLRYATAIDSRDWDLLETCFTADATGLYGQVELGDRDQIVEHVRSALTGVDEVQHFIADQQVRLEGEEVTSSSYLYAYHVWRTDPPRDFHIRGGYRDRIRRQPDGWRIVHRHRLEATWDRGDRSHLGGRAARSD